MKYSTIIVLMFLVVLGCSNSNSEEKTKGGIKIFGTVDNPGQGFILLKEITNRSFNTLDTITLAEDKTFSYNFYGDPGFYRIEFYGKQAVTVILDELDIELHVDGANSEGKLEIKGSVEYDQITKFNQSQQRIFAQRESEINQRYAAAKGAGDNNGASKAQADYMELLVEKEDLTIKTIKTIGPNLAAFQLISNIDKDRNFEFVDSMSLVLSKKLPKHEIYSGFGSPNGERKGNSRWCSSPRNFASNT